MIRKIYRRYFWCSLCQLQGGTGLRTISGSVHPNRTGNLRSRRPGLSDTAFPISIQCKARMDRHDPLYPALLYLVHHRHFLYPVIHRMDLGSLYAYDHLRRICQPGRPSWTMASDLWNRQRSHFINFKQIQKKSAAGIYFRHDPLRLY